LSTLSTLCERHGAGADAQERQTTSTRSGSNDLRPEVPGPITKRLLDTYSELVACDIAGQYLARLE